MMVYSKYLTFKKYYTVGAKPEYHLKHKPNNDGVLIAFYNSMCKLFSLEKNSY